jgi:hypothetical protein
VCALISRNERWNFEVTCVRIGALLLGNIVAAAYVLRVYYAFIVYITHGKGSLWGVTCAQAWHYYQQFPNDSRFLKWLVLVLLALDTVHQGLITHTGGYTPYFAVLDATEMTQSGVMLSLTMLIRLGFGTLFGHSLSKFFRRQLQRSRWRTFSYIGSTFVSHSISNIKLTSRIFTDVHPQ